MSNIIENKTIYFTYKKKVPEKVFNRWTKLNPSYSVDFSLDNDCIIFLEKHFGNKIANIFLNIKAGMFKADLWRLCKLYIHGGVYSDVDIVPYIQLNSLYKDVSFYSCLSMKKGSIFQAFMYTKKKNPIILCCIICFILNKAYTIPNGPTYDMYNCIKNSIGDIDINSEIKYKIKTVKIPITVGYSDKNLKIIDLFYFPKNIKYKIKVKKNQFPDKFIFKIHENKLYVIRTDQDSGWGQVLKIDICIKSEECIYLFQENCGKTWVDSYVVHKGNKIFDSRDLEYYKNGFKW